MKTTGTTGLRIFIALVSIVVLGTKCQDENAPPKVPYTAIHSDAHEPCMLDLAFDAAAAMPKNPHIKNKARAQSSVVDACLKTKDAARALQFAMQIPNWRKGLGVASYAYYCAQKGQEKEAARALEISRTTLKALANDGNEQEWRGKKIAAVIGATEEVLAFGVGATEDSGLWTNPRKAKFAAFADGLVKDEDFDQFAKSLRTTFESEDFAAVELAFESCLSVFHRYYQDHKRRDFLEHVVKKSYSRLPLTKRVDLVISLGEAALDHKDFSAAARLAGYAFELVAQAKWRPRDEIALNARIAALTFQAGDTDTARDEITAACDLYKTSRLRIVSVFRGQALRPLAEAFVKMNDTKQALYFYSQALDEALINPNSRPRAQELVAICISMATHHCRWSDELKEKALRVRSELGAPW